MQMGVTAMPWAIYTCIAIKFPQSCSIYTYSYTINVLLIITAPNEYFHSCFKVFLHGPCSHLSSSTVLAINNNMLVLLSPYIARPCLYMLAIYSYIATTVPNSLSRLILHHCMIMPDRSVYDNNVITTCNRTISTTFCK